MKRSVKILGIIAAVVVVALIGLAVAAKILITPERVKAYVLPLISEKLHREVTLGEVKVSLFRGITLNDLAVGERQGEEKFVAVDQVALRYQLWPLLQRRVVVDEVRLVGPRLRVERLPDGSFNFSDLLPKPGEKPPAQAGEPTAGRPIDLLVSEVAVSDGAVLFLDRAVDPSRPAQLTLDQLEAKAGDISLQRAFPFTLQGRLAGAALSVEGTADPVARGGKARVKVADLDVTAFAPYFQPKLPGRLAALRLSADLDAEGNAQAVASAGRVELKSLDLVLNALKEAPLRGDVVLDHRLKADLAKASLAIEEAKLAYGGLAAAISGRVEQYATEPQLDLTVTVPETDLKKLVAALPPALAQKARPFDPSGAVSARARLAGATATPKKLLKDGEVRLAAVQASAGGLRPEINGSLLLQGDSFSSRDLTVAAGGNRATVDLKGANLLGKPVSVAARVSAERFELDKLLQTGGAAGGPKPGAGTAGAPAREIGPFDLPLRADATVQIKKTVFKGLAVDDFDLHALLDRNVMTVDRLTGSVARGSFRQTARIDLTRPGLAYVTHLGLKGIQAEPLVAAFAPKAAGTIFGALDFDADLSGSGTLPEAVKRNISGRGSFSLVDARLTGPGFVQELAGYLNLPALRDMRFRQAKGSFSIDRGKVLLNSDFSGRDVRFAPTGSVSLDGSLDVGLDLRLSPELTGRLDRRGKVAQFFTDAQGWGQVPLKVTGTVGKPRFAFDATAVKGKVQEKVREKIEKKLQEKVFDKLAPKEKEGAKTPEKQLLEDAVKGLLGR
jgi:AsmA protein